MCAHFCTRAAVCRHHSKACRTGATCESTSTVIIQARVMLLVTRFCLLFVLLQRVHRYSVRTSSTVIITWCCLLFVLLQMVHRYSADLPVSLTRTSGVHHMPHCAISLPARRCAPPCFVFPARLQYKRASVTRAWSVGLLLITFQRWSVGLLLLAGQFSHFVELLLITFQRCNSKLARLAE